MTRIRNADALTALRRSKGLLAYIDKRLIVSTVTARIVEGLHMVMSPYRINIKITNAEAGRDLLFPCRNLRSE